MKGGGGVEDAEIVALLLERDEEGLHALLRHYGPLLRYVIAPILPDGRDREECLSETAMRVWENIGTFDLRKGSLRAWLTAVARNAALNRRRGAPRIQDGTEALDTVEAPDPTPEEAVLLRERREALSLALRQVSEQERIMFYRKYYYLQSTAQIAAELGMTERAVEGKLYRLKRRLREVLEHEGYGRP